jgi:hypothetical protein
MAPPFLTSVLGVGECRVTPGKQPPVPTGPRVGLDVTEKGKPLTPTGTRTQIPWPSSL